MIRKFKYELEIQIDDEEISKKYPNYRFSYGSPLEFAESYAKSLEFDELESYGYKVLIKEKE